MLWERPLPGFSRWHCVWPRPAHRLRVKGSSPPRGSGGCRAGPGGGVCARGGASGRGSRKNWPWREGTSVSKRVSWLPSQPSWVPLAQTMPQRMAVGVDVREGRPAPRPYCSGAGLAQRVDCSPRVRASRLEVCTGNLQCYFSPVSWPSRIFILFFLRFQENDSSVDFGERVH